MISCHFSRQPIISSIPVVVFFFFFFITVRLSNAFLDLTFGKCSVELLNEERQESLIETRGFVYMLPTNDYI
jgi:hypothetical protein